MEWFANMVVAFIGDSLHAMIYGSKRDNDNFNKAVTILWYRFKITDGSKAYNCNVL